MMNVTVQIPMTLLREAVEKQKEVDCERCQAYFDLFPEGYDVVGWRINWVCGTNQGIGSDTGYGVGFHCSKDCKIRVPIIKRIKK
jgi:hypothetical protein